jgi:hypothetical protein
VFVNDIKRQRQSESKEIRKPKNLPDFFALGLTLPFDIVHKHTNTQIPRSSPERPWIKKSGSRKTTHLERKTEYGFMQVFSSAERKSKVESKGRKHKHTNTQIPRSSPERPWISYVLIDGRLGHDLQPGLPLPLPKKK